SYIAPGDGSFSFLRMDWGHEPGLARSSRRQSAQISPMKNERTHVRSYKVYGERPFVFLRMHWGHEPELARSSRRQSAQASPMKNERTHVRCYTRFMESVLSFFAHALG